MNLFELAAVLILDHSAYDSGLSDAEKKAVSFGSAMKSGLSTVAKVSAAAIGTASTAVVAFGKSSVDAGMAFDSSMSQVAAVSGASGDELDKLRDKAAEMGAKTKFSASEAADAMNYMAMAGWKTNDMLGGIEGIMNLAAASGENLATTSDIVTDALTAFGLKAKDSTHFADVLAVASSNANTNVGMMGETFKYVAPVAGALGYSAEDSALAIGLMANSGIKASQAGTALRSVFTRLAKPPKEAASAMNELGVSLTDDEGNMKSFKEVIEDMRKGFANLGIDQDEYNKRLEELNKQYPESKRGTKAYKEELDTLNNLLNGNAKELQAQYAAMLGGQEAMSGLLAIVNASEEDYNKLANSINECDDAAAKMAETMQDNLKGDLDKFNSALESAKITLSDQLTPTLREFVQFGANGIGKITEGFKSGRLEGAMTAFGTVLSDGISMITNMLPDIVKAGSQVLTAFVNGITQNIESITQAALSIAITLFNAISENAPKFLEAGITVLQTLMNGISENIGSITETIVQLVVSIAETLTNPETLTGLLDVGLQIIVGLAQGILNALPALVDKLPTIILNIVNFLISSIPMIIDAGVKLLSALVEDLPAIVGKLVAAIPTIVSGIASAVTGNIDQIIRAGIELFVALIAATPEIIGGIVAAIPEIINGIVDGFMSFLGSFNDVGKNLISGLWQGFESMGEWLGEKIFGFFDNVINGIKNFLGIHSPSTVFAGMGENLIAGLWEGIKGMGDWIGGKVSGFFGGIVDGIKNMLGIHSPSTVFAEMGENMALGIGKGFDDEFSSIRDGMNDQMDFTANADVNVNKSGAFKGGYGTNGEITSAEKQPLTVIVQLSSGVELGRALIDNINQAKRVDGLVY